MHIRNNSICGANPCEGYIWIR